MHMFVFFGAPCLAYDLFGLRDTCFWPIGHAVILLLFTLWPLPFTMCLILTHIFMTVSDVTDREKILVHHSCTYPTNILVCEELISTNIMQTQALLKILSNSVSFKV